MARTNYSFEKRQRELAKQKKKEEKRRRKLENSSVPSGDEADERRDIPKPASE